MKQNKRGPLASSSKRPCPSARVTGEDSLSEGAATLTPSVVAMSEGEGSKGAGRRGGGGRSIDEKGQSREDERSAEAGGQSLLFKRATRNNAFSTPEASLCIFPKSVP